MQARHRRRESAFFQMHLAHLKRRLAGLSAGSANEYHHARNIHDIHKIRHDIGRRCKQDFIHAAFS